MWILLLWREGDARPYRAYDGPRPGGGLWRGGLWLHPVEAFDAFADMQCGPSVLGVVVTKNRFLADFADLALWFAEVKQKEHRCLCPLCPYCDSSLE